MFQNRLTDQLSYCIFSANCLPKNTAHHIFHIYHVCHFQVWLNHTIHNIFSAPSQSTPRNNPWFVFDCVRFWVCRKLRRFHLPILSLADLSSYWEHPSQVMVQFRLLQIKEIIFKRTDPTSRNARHATRRCDDTGEHILPCIHQTEGVSCLWCK